VQILATAELPATAHRLIGAIGEISISAGDLVAEARACDVLLVRAEQADAPVLAAARRLKVIARTGSGVDNIDVVAATERGIPVVNAPDAGTGPVAEGTWTLIFAAAKRLGELQGCLAAERWQHRYAIEGLDLRGATLGVIGLGSIGREVASIGLALGMRVQGFDPLVAEEAISDPSFERTDLETLMRNSDVISLHCALTDSTRGLVDRDLLQLTTRRPVLVNAARGAVVDGDALLLEALDNGWLSGVGLDVFADEPPRQDSPLLRDPRVVCTPHAVGLTRHWNERVFSALAADISAVLAGEQPCNIVNPNVLEGIGSS
jgi:D-3-phosphoglycerate dehydrogenase